MNYILIISPSELVLVSIKLLLFFFLYLYQGQSIERLPKTFKLSGFLEWLHGKTYCTLFSFKTFYIITFEKINHIKELS